MNQRNERHTLSSELDSILDGDAAPAETVTLPAAGRDRTAVAGSGTNVSLQVGESFEAVYNGFAMVTGLYGESKSHRFTLIAPASLTTVTKDKETKEKTVAVKDLAAGSQISLFMAGNGDWSMGSIPVGLDVEVKRIEDGTLPKGHKYAGRPVATYSVLQ